MKQNTDHFSLSNKETIGKMQVISNNFYGQACNLGVHQFIEFAGLMNEFIKMCSQTLEAGSDYTQTNIHSNEPGLIAHGFNGDYLAEKFECIFGKTFADNKEFTKAFLEKMGFPTEFTKK